MLPFILINVVVSTVIVLAILLWWDSRGQGEATSLNDSADNTVATPTVIAAAGQENQLAPATAVATDVPPLHVVQPGETLGSISEFYEVPLDDILAANGLTNPNVIAVGQLLEIPINGLVVPTAIPEPTEDPSFIPEPIDTQPAPDGTDFVVEISQVSGVGEIEAEAVQIRNSGSSSVALLGWTLADQDGFFYTFGPLTLFGDGAGLLIFTGIGQDAGTEVYWGLDSAIWDPAESVTLLDSNGNIVDTYTISP